jgi:hypothetical protein
MKTYFVCLANSKKYGERCIAGIELLKNESGDFTPLLIDSRPKWVRPVSGDINGQVPSELVKGIALFDIVEIEILERKPLRYQSENTSFEPNSIKVVGKYDKLDFFETLLVEHPMCIFGNRGKALDEQSMQHIHRSLILVKVSQAIVHVKFERFKYHFRLQFLHNNVKYDLPITDVDYIDKYLETNKDFNSSKKIEKDVFLTISLGIVFEGWYYKLVAGILEM